jgi:chromosome segregation ATPase
MKALSKPDQAQLETYMERLQDRWSALADALEQFNTQIEAAWAMVEEAETAYNETVADFRSFQAEIAQQIRDYMDERSEKWQEGLRGQAYAGWIEPWENEELIEEADLAMPDLVDFALDEPSEGLGELDTAPDEA